MLYTLTFGQFNLVSDDIVELVIDKASEISLEQFLEFKEVIEEILHHPFAVLLNSVNSFTFSTQTLTHIAQYDQLIAIAGVSFFNQTNKNIPAQSLDNINIQWFSAFEFGCSKGLNWLELELSKMAY